MKLLNHTLVGFAAAFAFVSSACATPITFTLTSISLTGNSGYGSSTSNQSDPNPNLLDVTFSSSSVPASFDLIPGGVKTFTFGSAHLYDTCINPSIACGNVGNETQNLGVTATFNFSSPYFTNPGTGTVGYMPVVATGTAYVGLVKDATPDRTVDLDIVFAPVTVDFGSGGQFTIDLSEMEFVSNSTVSTTATITLLAAPAPAASVPEPASLSLVGLGLLGAGLGRRRMSANKSV